MVLRNMDLRKFFFSLLIFFLVISLHHSMATNFYFSSVTGDDSRNFIQAKNPESPWRSIAKLNAIFGSLQPGDTVFFKRNEAFFGTIHLRTSGASGNPIVISAYGAGEDPIISGWVELKKWVSDGNGIYRTSADSLLFKTNLLMVNEQPREMGRFPNQGFIPFQKGEMKNSLLVQSDFSPLKFKNSLVVIRKNHWIIDKHPVVSIKGSEIIFSGESKYDLISGFGFFFQDHLQTLDAFGEWFHDDEGKEVFLYFGDIVPAKCAVKASAVDYLVTNTPKVQHIVLENLRFSGANKTGIQLIEAKAIQLKKCTVEYSGKNALTAISVPGLTVVDSKVHYAQNSGLFLRYGTPDAVITNNVIEKVHLFPGMGSNGDGNGMAIHCLSDDGLIANNNISEIGYSGVVFNGNRTIVKNNYIDSFCLVKNDGGGIYTYEGPDNKEYENRKISHNIIVNGMGNTAGTLSTSKFSKPQVEGIYIDDNASGIEITDNSVANVRRNGINLHNSRNVTLTGNSIYNAYNQLSISHDHLGQPVRNIKVSGNTFIAPTETQKIFTISSIKEDFNEMVQFRDNIYVYPEGNDFVFQIKTQEVGGEKVPRSFNMKQWMNGPIQDLNSKYVAVAKPIYSVEDRCSTLSQSGPFQEKSMEVKCLDENCNLTRSSGEKGAFDIKIYDNQARSGIKINVGAVNPASQYLLRLKVSTIDYLTAYLVLRHKGHPWSNVSESFSFQIEPFTETIEKVFSFPDETEAGIVVLGIEDEKGAFTLENIEWIEADITYEKPEIWFQYNPTPKPSTIKLSHRYVDVNREEYIGEIILAPFSSKILFQQD